MRNRSQTLNDLYGGRSGRHVRMLAWIEARNRQTGAVESIGFWTGEDTAEFAIQGQTRTYYGAGAMIGMSPLTFEAGLKVRTQRLILSQVAPSVLIAMRQYDPRLAPVEIHVAHFDPLTEHLLEEPERVFKGIVDRAPIPTAAVGQSADFEVALVGPAERLRRTLSLKKSDAGLKSRAPGDSFRAYTDVTGSVEAYWGEKRAAAPENATQAPAASVPNQTSQGV